MDHEQLAKALNITIQELNSLDFYNEEIFDNRGIAVLNQFVFNESSPKEILNKIKGLDKNNRITLKV